MNTYREVSYLCLDLLKSVSDDSYYTLDHIMYLMDKYRAFILKKTYSDIKKEIPESNYQTLCLDLEEVQNPSNTCTLGHYLRSVDEIPEIVGISKPKISSVDFLQGEITYVSPERMKATGYNKWLSNIIYGTIGPDNKLYLKSNNPQAYSLERVKIKGIFESPSKAIELSCKDKDVCEVLDAEFPLEEGLIPQLVEFIIKDLIGATYRPSDSTNNAADDLSDIMSYIRRNMKDNTVKQLEQ